VNPNLSTSTREQTVSHALLASLLTAWPTRWGIVAVRRARRECKGLTSCSLENGYAAIGRSPWTVTLDSRRRSASLSPRCTSGCYITSRDLESASWSPSRTAPLELPPLGHQHWVAQLLLRNGRAHRPRRGLGQGGLGHRQSRGRATFWPYAQNLHRERKEVDRRTAGVMRSLLLVGF